MAVKKKTGPATGLLDAMAFAQQAAAAQKVAADAAATQNAAAYWQKKDEAIAAGITGGTNAPAQATLVMYDRAPAREALMALFRQYGMEDLASSVDSFIVDNGANDTYTLAERVRSSDQYKNRFKGLLALRNKGVTDVADEGQYLRLEADYRQKFRESGLQSFLGNAGTQTERDALADLVGKYSISVNEVGDRIADAQRVIADTPQEVRDSLQRYYNVDPATLVSYVLDPARNAQQINRLANAAIVGGYGTRAGLDISLEAAGGMSDLFNGQDLNLDALQTDLSAARTIRDETKRLAQIEGQDLTDTEAFQAQLKTSAEAEQKVKRLQSSERGRFGGSSGFAKGALSRPAVF